ncbi:hypothetical protein JCGZ_10847 [Jatropha curcas]|uniref:Uncharacterized protein n=1 Tax=Jatropha curcas TaxID=180498 RepID=A0A067KI50_JATCU|nr:hypothetical protein JCGZ_10847 [Jatropha curcas]
MEPTISDKRVCYYSISAHYEEMPPERAVEMDVDILARAFLFYLLSTTLFTNNGNNADLALLPSLQDIDATKKFNRAAIALSYLYYEMDLCVQGAPEDVVAVHVHPSIEFDPFAEADELDRDQDTAPARRQQRGKRVSRGFDFEALDTTVVVASQSMVRVPLSLLFQSALGGPHEVEVGNSSVAGELVTEQDAD